MDFAEAKRVIAAFERHQVACVVTVSMAMATQEIVRATRHSTSSWRRTR